MKPYNSLEAIEQLVSPDTGEADPVQIKALSKDDAKAVLSTILKECYEALTFPYACITIARNLIKERDDLDLNTTVEVNAYNSHRAGRATVKATPLEHLLGLIDHESDRLEFTTIANMLMSADQIDLLNKELFVNLDSTRKAKVVFRHGCIKRFVEALLSMKKNESELSALMTMYASVDIKTEEVFKYIEKDFIDQIEREKTPRLQLDRVYAFKLNCDQSCLYLYLDKQVFYRNKMEAAVRLKEESIKRFLHAIDRTTKLIRGAEAGSGNFLLLFSKSSDDQLRGRLNYFRYDRSLLTDASIVSGHCGGMFGSFEREVFYKYLNYAPPVDLATAIDFPRVGNELPITYQVLRALYADIYIYDLLKAGPVLHDYVAQNKHRNDFILNAKDSLMSFLVDFQLFCETQASITSQALSTPVQHSSAFNKPEVLVDFLKKLLLVLSSENNPVEIKRFIADNFQIFMSYILAKPQASISFSFLSTKQDKMTVIQNVLKSILRLNYTPKEPYDVFTALDEPLRRWNHSSTAEICLEQVFKVTRDTDNFRDQSIESILEAYAIYLRIEKAMPFYIPGDLNQLTPDNPCLVVWKKLLAEGPRFNQIIASITWEMMQKDEPTNVSSSNNQPQEIYDELAKILPLSLNINSQTLKEADLEEFKKIRHTILLYAHPDKTKPVGVQDVDFTQLNPLLESIRALKQNSGNSASIASSSRRG